MLVVPVTKLQFPREATETSSFLHILPLTLACCDTPGESMLAMRWYKLHVYVNSVLTTVSTSNVDEIVRFTNITISFTFLKVSLNYLYTMFGGLTSMEANYQSEFYDSV